MNVLVPLPIVLPLLAAGLALPLGRRLDLQRVVSTVAVVTAFAATLAVLLAVVADGPVAVDVGGWPAPVGITLVADELAMLVLAVSMATVLAVLLYSIGEPNTDERSPFFHPLYLVLTAGVCASFLTGDLFNLFVAFEVMLVASYVLITLRADRPQVRSGMTYVVINLLASTLLITAVGLVYAATGTVNMADLVGRLDLVPGGVRTALGLMLLVVFGIKAAIFPLFFWLPDAYPTAPTPVTAVFAGLLTKVGVYAIIRTQTLLFPGDGTASELLLVLAALTMVVGVLGAIAQDDVKRILSFHIVSQIGYMIFGLALFTVAGVAGAVFYVVHHIPVKTSLFMVGGLVESATGTAALRRLGGLVHRLPLTAALFLLPALSLAGFPPFSGFLGKLSLVQAGLSDGHWAVTAVSLLVGLGTVFSMVKIWSGVFWGAPEDVPPTTAAPAVSLGAIPRLMTASTVGLVGVTLVVALSAGWIYEISERAAAGLLEPSRYVSEVLE